MKRTISIGTLIRMLLAIAAIVIAPVILRYGIKNSEQTSQQVAPIGEVTGSGTNAKPAINTGDANAATVSAVQPFKPVERKPRLLAQPNPGYPEIAQLLRLEGKVIVKVLVDKQGHPRRAIVIKSDSEVFNEAARKAALEARFRPAVMNSGPVKCWVLIPYRFKLG